MMKKIVALLLAAVLLLGLVACGEKDNGLSGKYVCTKIVSDETVTEPNGQWIKLESGGKGTYYDGFEFTMKWKMSGENISATVSFMGLENTMTGTLKNGVLVLNNNGEVRTYVREGMPVPEDATVPVTEATEAVSSLAGVYPIFSLEMEGQVMSRADMEAMDMAEGTYLELREDFTGVVQLSGEDPEEFTFDPDAGVLYTADGEEFPFVVDGDMIAVTMEDEGYVATLTFVTDEYLAAHSTDPVDPDIDDNGDQDEDTLWYGWLAVAYTDGVDNRFSDAWVYLDVEESTGKPYLEVYENEEEESPILSLYIRREGDIIYPVIGDEDAWLMDQYLTEENSDLICVIQDGTLFGYYSWQDENGKACEFSFGVRPYGDTWEGQGLTPPGLDDYLAELY